MYSVFSPVNETKFKIRVHKAVPQFMCQFYVTSYTQGETERQCEDLYCDVLGYHDTFL
jgi:hypothetical protein